MFKFCKIFVSFPNIYIAHFINNFVGYSSVEQFLIKNSLRATVTLYGITLNKTQIMRKS